ncbi:hypothetical protein [Mesorhizobium sp. WSM2239]|uniref:Uncharacterized protein n=2 Tax=unclassified Mesorhizobium TaxID=325217 RepID=A0AAU8DEY7_9HYPH
MRIDFPFPVEAEGRNGYFSAPAISVHRLFEKEVWLQNITSRNGYGRGHATLPADPDTLRQVAEHLNNIATSIELGLPFKPLAA